MEYLELLEKQDDARSEVIAEVAQPQPMPRPVGKAAVVVAAATTHRRWW